MKDKRKEKREVNLKVYGQNRCILIMIRTIKCVLFVKVIKKYKKLKKSINTNKENDVFTKELT